MKLVIYLGGFYKLIFAGGIKNRFKTLNVVFFTYFYLISLFLTACINRPNGQNSISAGETKAVMEYENIVPVENKPIIELQFVDNRLYEFRDGSVSEEIMYYALGEHGEYFFAPGEWKNEHMLQLIAVSEEGTKFAKDWLGYESDKLISFVYGNMRYSPPTNPKSHIQKLWSGGNGFYGEVFINISDEFMPAIIVHEVVHSLLRMQERSSNFPLSPETAQMRGVQFLEEGLATVIDYMFFLETDHIYGEHGYYGYGTDKQASEGILHRLAVRKFRTKNNFVDTNQFGIIYPQLMSYETAASFVYFLLKYKGTKEDFIRVFVDINLMEEIYKTSMDDMIAEWLLYLRKYK